MAITGSFLADFSSFYDAVRQADVELNGFQQNAAKVESALDRATNAFSGQKIIQQATIAVEAVERIGGVTKLTEKEQERLNAQLTEAIAKYTAIGEQAPQQMTDLAAATAKAGKETEVLATETADLAKSGESAATTFGKDWVSGFTSQVTSMAAGLVSAQAIMSGVSAAWRSLTAFVGGSIESFSAAEAAQRTMTVALANLGQATPRATAYMGDLAAQFQNTTKYGDDLINEMQALLMQVGQVLPSQMEGALTAATDLASGLGVDLKQATTAVAQAFDGNAGSLQRYGISIDEARLKAEGMPYVLDEIQKRFGGQAAAELDTYAGRLAHLANTWDNVKEAVGENIVSSPILEAALRVINEAANAAAEGAGGAEKSWSAFARTVGATNFAEGISQLEDLTATFNEAAWAREQFQRPQTSANASIVLGTAEDQARITATVAAELKNAADAAKAKEKADTEAAAAAKAHASAVQSLREQLSGDGAIKQASLYVEAMAGVKDVSRLNAEAQKQVADALWKGMEAYRVQGQEVPKIMADIYAAVATIPPPIMAATDALASMGTKVALPAIESIIKPMQDLTAAAEAYEAETRRQVDAWTAAQGAADEASAATARNQQVTQAATATVVQMNVALGQNKSALESVAAGYELMQAYQRAGVAMGSQLAAGGYNFQQMQQTGRPNVNVAPGLGAPPIPSGAWSTGWGTQNTLNVNVNSTDANDIASKLVTEMRHSGVRF